MDTRKKKGLIWLLVAAVFVIISVALYSADISGIIFALVTLVWVVSLIIGLVYLIKGFMQKE